MIKITLKTFCGNSRTIKIAAFVLCSYFLFAVQIKALVISGDEILRNEDEARKLAFMWNDNAVKQALQMFEEAAIHWENQKNFENSARCLREAAKLKLQLSEDKSALELLNKALQLENNLKNLEGKADTYSLLAIVLTGLGDNQRSSFYHQKALKTAEKSGDPKYIAYSLMASGNFYYGQRKFQDMLQQQEKALALFREIGDTKSESEILIDLAYSYTINNDRIRGRDTALKAIELSRNSGNKRSEVLGLIALGDAYHRMGESENALKVLAEAKTLFTPNLDLFYKAIIYNRFGHYYKSYNDLAEAQKLFQTSYDIFEQARNIEGQSETLSVLGEICILRNDLNQALENFNKSRTIAEKSGDAMPLALVNLRIGEVNLGLENFSEAEKNLNDSLNYYKNLGIQYRIAEVQEKLGLVFEKKNNYIEAEKKYSIALEINRKIHSKFAQAQNYFYLARINKLQNKVETGIENITKSIELTEFSNDGTSNSKLKRDFFTNVYDRYELFINLLMKKHKENPNENYIVESLRAAEKSRARSILETMTLAQANFSKDANPETIKRENEIRNLLNLKSDKLTDLLSRNAEKAEIEKLDYEINELENELEEIKANLKLNSPQYSALKNPEPFNVRDFQDRVLDENSILLEFSLGRTESYLWLIGKNEIQTFILPPREEIESKAENLRQLIAAHVRKNGENIEDYQRRINEAAVNFPAAAKDLSNSLFGQIADKLTNKRLIIVPDGKLHYFPFSALPLPNSDSEHPILLSNEIIYEPSASTLALITKNDNQQKSIEKNILVFSDPVFTANDPRFGNEIQTTQSTESNTDFADKLRFAESLNSLPRLEESKNEGDSILQIAGFTNSDLFTGFDATREQFLNSNSSDYKILHFATHGLIDESRPELSGIIFSGFNEKREKLNQVVRLQDIYGLNLNADLVVLSACETGIGKEVKGEGLLSLNNGFLQIGAKSVLSSLWKVEDAATVELMKNFYQILADEKITSSKALQKAQIRLWESGRYKSPFYWAAFTIQGDFQRQPEISRSFSVIYLALAFFSVIILLGAVFIYFFKFRRKI